MRTIVERISRDAASSWTYFARSSNQFDVVHHRHPEIELTFVLGGEGIRQVAGSVDRFSDGDLVLVGSNVPHAYWTDKAPAPVTAPGGQALSYMVETAFPEAYANLGITPIAYNPGPEQGGFFTFMEKKAETDPGYREVMDAVILDMNNPSSRARRSSIRGARRPETCRRRSGTRCSTGRSPWMRPSRSTSTRSTPWPTPKGPAGDGAVRGCGAPCPMPR
ncbi:cupin domain-containing protein [Tessaracoccus sp. HDW20]|uniref:cupin domain-containing protein n=1 Tax=Tessaracoccus coleopterorum TaxID=2714950 RepID=UPI0018D49E12|nr:cupin domain-containing protein [Tessaracoccus coleopterorum]NHB84607.1 cupin domain-containing protein [Tessaracoccus coleopterorum]